MEVQELEQVYNRLQLEYRTLQLKLTHYRETLDQKEERIADLRVEITGLNERIAQLEKALRPTEDPNVKADPEDTDKTS